MVNSGKRWALWLLVLSLAALLGICALTICIDPFFHYHAPLSFLEYPLEKERYQNDGIAKHFSYDAILAGTSMTQNFKTTQCDDLFGVTSVKTCFNGSSLREASEHLERAVAANPDIKLIIRGYDGWNLLEPAETFKESDKIPFYLYDHNPFNDVSYLLNKTVLLQDTLGVLKYTLKGNQTTSFDEYARWDHYATFGAETILGNYQRPPKSDTQAAWTHENAELLRENLARNAIQLARDNPQIQFCYFFTPYSIVYMDEQHRWGILEQQFAAYRQSCEEMLALDNIRVFSFFDDYERICDLSCYCDPAHYNGDYNAWMLQSMAHGEHELTLENYDTYWDQVEAYYLSYDYDALFP